MLIFLLEPKFLVHISNSLLETSLKRRDLITQLLFLVLCRVTVFQGVFELVNAFCGFLAIFSKPLYFASALHTSSHLHAAVHLLGDLGE